MNDKHRHAALESLRDFDTPGRAVAAAAALQRDASVEDVPRLVALLSDSEFFVREAAAWPLSDLGRVEALPQLIEAHKAGSADGHDNDGLSAAVVDLVTANASASRPILLALIERSDSRARAVAEWLLSFCEP